MLCLEYLFIYISICNMQPWINIWHNLIPPCLLNLIQLHFSSVINCETSRPREDGRAREWAGERVAAVRYRPESQRSIRDPLRLKQAPESLSGKGHTVCCNVSMGGRVGGLRGQTGHLMKGRADELTSWVQLTIREGHEVYLLYN